MGRAMALVAVVAIIAVVVLAIWFSHRRHAHRREDFRALQRENARLRGLIAEIRSEATAQLAAGQVSHDYTLRLITEHDRKELTS